MGRKRASDWTGGVSPEQMARQFTPQQAARIKYRALLFQSMDPCPRIDEMLRNDPGHRWFNYCLDTVARREA